MHNAEKGEEGGEGRGGGEEFKNDVRKMNIRIAALGGKERF